MASNSEARWANTLASELGTADRRADDLSDCFDFSQTPRPYVTVETSETGSNLTAMPPSNVPPDSY
jgi:hypothetical protein